VIQEKEFERVGGEKTIRVDVRLITATSRNLEDLVAQGRFREDLYYRLNVVPLFLPPLRDRSEDIPLLVEHFLKKFNEENGRKVSLTAEVIDTFLSYDWPGNVRELENTIERLVVMSDGKSIKLADLPISMRDQTLKKHYATQGRDALLPTIEEIEKTRILEALNRTGWVQSRAARILGITARQIGYKIKKHNLQHNI
jgi:Nif-specific regulatory protein